MLSWPLVTWRHGQTNNNEWSCGNLATWPLGCSDKGKSLILASEKKDNMLYMLGKCPMASFTIFEPIFPTHFCTKVLVFLAQIRVFINHMIIFQ